MTTAKEAREIIAKSQQTNVIRSSVAGAPAVATLPEIQCSKGSIESPEHYRQLLDIIDRDHTEQWEKLAREHTELRKAHLKLEKDHVRTIEHLAFEQKENAKLKKRLDIATEMATCPPSNEALDVSCPTCGSNVAQACRDEFGNSRGLVNFHDARIARWNAENPTLPPIGPACTCREIQEADSKRHFRGCPQRVEVASVTMGDLSTHGIPTDGI
jgi:hypothetical protein